MNSTALGCLTALLVAAMPAAGQHRSEAADPPNILLVTIDTLRADHLSCYGYHRKTSPNMDALAAQGFGSSTPTAPSR